MKQKNSLKTIKYTVLNPTNNITIFSDTPVPSEHRAAIGNMLLKAEPLGEQAGFISIPKPGSALADAGVNIRLDMAGGEFCGNATMSAAALFASRNGITEGAVTVSCSGAPNPLRVQLKLQPDGCYIGTVSMPRPLELKNFIHPDEGSETPGVVFEGVTHLIHVISSANTQHSDFRSNAESLISRWCSELHAPCLGLLFYNPETHTMTPLVYVASGSTLYWENSCASGTSALGYWLARSLNKTIDLDITEPGGILHVYATPEGEIRLTGNVKIEKAGCLEI